MGYVSFLSEHRNEMARNQTLKSYDQEIILTQGRDFHNKYAEFSHRAQIR